MATILRFMFTLAMILLAMLLLAFPFVERGSGAYAISLVSFVMLGIILVSIVIIIRSEWEPFE